MDDHAAWLCRARERHERGEDSRLAARDAGLERLGRAIETRERELLDALRADLRKPESEAWASEIGVVLTDIRHARRRLARWARPRRRPLPLALFPGSGHVRAEPLGVVLILGPWNYPFQLVASPLVGAIAAGNAACLKVSERVPRVAEVTARVIRDAFDPDHVTCVEGGPDVARELVGSGFDHVFFTGSTAVGREVMVAAANRLTPVTLELGGKCPCIVFGDARLPIAARRIAWGKFLNAGQSCVAPDYVLVQRGTRDALIEELRRAVEAFYGPDPCRSADYGRIANARQFGRLLGLLKQGRPAFGGEYDAADLYIAPTVLTEPDPDGALMTEEIFGPILPVVEFDALDDVVRDLRARPAPLAVYAFTESRDRWTRVLRETRSGGAAVNDVVAQILAKDLPFGGVGASGTGSYHGRAGFDRFTHYRSVLRRRTWLDPGMHYPPVRFSLETLRRAYGLLFRR